jgi:hypothetical protein
MRTSEMIAMLEKNPKLRFKATEWKDRTVLSLNEEGRIQLTNGHDTEPYAAEVVLRYLTNLFDWEIVQEPVPVWEAVKAYYEGKQVTCKCKGCKRFDGCIYQIRPNGKDLCREGILNGTWYIEEGEANG